MSARFSSKHIHPCIQNNMLPRKTNSIDNKNDQSAPFIFRLYGLVCCFVFSFLIWLIESHCRAWPLPSLYVLSSDDGLRTWCACNWDFKRIWLSIHLRIFNMHTIFVDVFVFVGYFYVCFERIFYALVLFCWISVHFLLWCTFACCHLYICVYKSRRSTTKNLFHFVQK